MSLIDGIYWEREYAKDREIRDFKKFLDDHGGTIPTKELLVKAGHIFNLVSTFKWNCPDSPIDFCVYHQTGDPVHDHCIYCSKPEERK